MITKQYQEALERQANRQNREITPINLIVAEAIEKTADKSLKATRDSKSTSDFQVISAPTGSAKTQSAIAYAISRYKSDPKYTCAFIVEQINQADDVYKELKHEIPRDDLGVWSHYHDAQKYERGLDKKGVHEEYEKYLFVPDLITPEEMKLKRIVVYTHRKWESEIKSDTDHGVRNYLGKPRDNLFVDEQPSMISVVEMKPKDIARMQELVKNVDDEHYAVPLLGTILRRMLSVYESTGNDLEEAELSESFNDFSKFLELAEDHNLINKMSLKEQDFFLTGIDFLLSCSKGYVFFSRRGDACFVAYLPMFKAESNIIILDGTADLSSSYQQMGGSLVGGMPQLDYSNLTIKQIEEPKKYSYIAKTLKSGIKSKEYAKFIKGIVKENTEEGDYVLIVCHKALVTTHLLFPETSDEPVSNFIDGRHIWILTWGQGIGSNKYNKATKVFSFNEFHKPKRITVAEALGYSQKKARDGNLNIKNGALTGSMEKAQESNLLRWQKQIIARGNVRNIDDHGVCGAMEMFTTMSWTRLIANLSQMFPNAKLPIRELKHVKSDKDKPKKRDKLVNFLSTSEVDEISFQELGKLLKMKSFLITRELNTELVQPTFKAYGWKIVKPNEIGKTGRSLWLVKS